MKDWSKRADSWVDAARDLLEMGGETGSRIAREFGGKWLPSAMRGLAQGLTGASKALNKGANKLRKNVRTFQLAPVPAVVPAVIPPSQR